MPRRLQYSSYVAILPLHFVRPIPRTQLARLRILGIVPCVIRLAPSFVFGSLRILSSPRHSLLTKTNCLYLITLLGHDNMTFRRVVWRPFGFIIPGYTCTGQT